MEVHCPDRTDWSTFHSLAAAEGWRISSAERRLFQGDWSRCARCLYEADLFAGFVTAVAHEESGWIGNLIVPEPLRGRGYGSRLFQVAMDDLLRQGVVSVWLTASEQGRPLYEKAGFVVVDQIERWVLPAGGESAALSDEMNIPLQSLFSLDREVWGENRQKFMAFLLSGNSLFSLNESAALLQRGADCQVVGPWYSRDRCPGSNLTLLQNILATVDTGVETVIDVLASSPVRALLAGAGFNCGGRTSLMVRGEKGSVDLGKMVALASLGSIG